MRNRTPLSIEVKQVLKWLMYTLCGMLLMSSAYFFVKMSNTAEKGYMLRENQIRQKNLESENRILQQQVLEAQSLNTLQSSNTASKLVSPDKPLYVMPKGPLTKRK